MRPSLLKPNQTVQYHGLCGRFTVKFVERAAADAGRPACNYFQADKFKTNAALPHLTVSESGLDNQ